MMRSGILMACLICSSPPSPASPADAEITHGPFVGHTTPTRASIWARASKPGDYELFVRRPGGPSVSRRTAIASIDHDLCMVWTIEGLQPNTEYLYQVDCPGAVSVGGPDYRFRTSLEDDDPGVVRLAFGSCAREDLGTARVWRRMQQTGADAIVLLGDTPYIDSTKLATQRTRYGEFAAVPAMRRLLTSTPWYGTWDDHDFGRNDTDGRVEGKENSRRAFVEYHANPSYGDGKEGIYTKFRRGPVEVFLLDTRTFAATEPSPFAPEKPTLLGRGQWRWLERGLSRSTARFKILACGMIWNGATRPNKPDHWMSYPHEREALFSLIGKLQITGIVLVGGDIHRSRALRYPSYASAGYPITELITSPMHGSIIEAANAPHPHLLHDAGEPYSFLLLTIDSTCAPARANAQILNADGREIFSVALRENDLAPVSHGNADLPPLLEFASGSPVRTREDFARRKEEIRQLLGEYFIGTFPPVVPPIVSAATLEETDSLDGSTRRRVRVTLGTPNKRAFEMWVWKPPGDGPFPVLLTQPRFYQIPWAEMALKRGYLVALYPGVDSFHREKDFPGYDSVWKVFREEYPDATWSEIATKAWLAGRALDYVLDPESGLNPAEGQVGIIGFSRYGKQSLIATAIDERITSVVARSPGSPGSCPYRFTSRNTFAEAPADFPGEWFLPRLREYNGREHQLPMDSHGWYALIAPRRCLIHTAHNDGSEPTFAVERAYLEGRRVYSFLGKPENLRVLYREGQHGPVTDAQREQNLDWFDLSFHRGSARQDDFPEEFIHGFDWKRWRDLQEGSGLRDPFGSVEPTDDADRRARIAWMLGRPPEDLQRNGIPRFLSDAESDMMTHDRWKAGDTERVPVNFGAGVRGNVYFNPEITEPAPVVIWLHPYSYHSGYNEGYGVEGTTVYHRLARAGMVVIAYDQCGFGLRLLEGRDFYDRHPTWSRLGRMIADVRAAVDFAIEGKGDGKNELPRMDRERVFLLGYSLGGMVALYAAALDERVRGVASFSGFTPMRDDSDSKHTGGIRRLWDWHGLVPRLGLFHGRESTIPYDYEDVLKLIAPRPCLLVAPQRDRNADLENVIRSVESARGAWGESEQLTVRTPDRVDRFQRAQHELFLSWLRRVSGTE